MDNAIESETRRGTVRAGRSRQSANRRRSVAKRDDLVCHVRAVAERAGPKLSRKRYEELRELGSPSSSTVIRRLGHGSWQAACRAAVVQSGRDFRPAKDSSVALRAAAEAISHPLSRWGYRQWRAEQDDPTVWPALERCGAALWLELCRSAGVQVALGRPSRLISDEAILGALRRAAPESQTPEAYSSWRRGQAARGVKATPSAGTVLARFGSWGKACMAAGIPGPRWAWSREELVQALRAAAGDLPLTRRRYEEWLGKGQGPAVSTLQRQFGSWGEALKAAGVGGGR